MKTQIETTETATELLVLVSITMHTARWLGMAASVAGGGVAISMAGRDAAQQIGRECIALVPESWLPDTAYRPLTDREVLTVTEFLGRRTSGWAGAEAINQDRAATAAWLL